MLSKDIGISRSELIKTSKRGDLHTWVHPRVAIHLAQWVSSSFAVQVTKDINQNNSTKQITDDISDSWKKIAEDRAIEIE